ncbi:hypothetical protein LMH73_012295 [Vibrio splendidus]|nr:hypothetical protein [Vibrio splendidus]MCC4880410.1 hypothetical protein [Vibrio splendidus]
MKYHTLKLCPTNDLGTLITSLPCEEFGKLMKLIFCIWEESESQHVIATVHPSVVAIFGGSGDAEDFVNKIAADKPDILTVSMDIESMSFDMNISSVLLQDKVKDLRLEQAKLANIKKFNDRSASESKTLLDALNKKDNELAIKYLGIESRSLDVYQGFLPTSRYELEGQAYIVRSAHLAHMRESFDGLDIEKELLDIFYWLRDNPLQRKPYVQMNTFIHNWMCRSFTKGSNTQDKLTNKFEFDDIPVDV